jgi:hypothetical protein
MIEQRRCDGCTLWTKARVTRYGNGETTVNFEAPEGKGACEMMVERLAAIEMPDEARAAATQTPADFSCARHEVCHEGYSHVLLLGTKPGAPWQHSHAGPCPDCKGRGSPDPGPVQDGQVAPSHGCHRCAGTGKVRYYDDGYVGEERTRLHPKERAVPLSCVECGNKVERDWVVCPKCGKRTEVPAETEQVSSSDQGLMLPPVGPRLKVVP